jgi:antitoxin (DNA-binding transcriptional repressor) of toxin-antitoxin stability system
MSESTVSLAEAKTRLSELAERAASGIGNRSVPVS